ncbi:MAG: NCS2 family permease [Deltaproteobacteria bacterium]|nr:NCS2 family permease [Deltaproteobacteria bacterium]
MSPDAPSPGFRPRLFVRGDIDGFFGLALDNLIQVLLISSLWTQVLGFSSERLYGRILPGVAVSLVIGNLFYAWQARALARQTGRTDVCALPYGINTVSLIGFVFLVLLPAKLAAANRGASPAEAEQIAYAAGVVAAVGSGLIEAGGAFVVGWLRRWTPRAAMLATLGGIAITFIAAGFLWKTFASPLVAFLPLGAVLLTYFGRVRFPLGLPGGLVAVMLGTALAWLTPMLRFDAAAFAAASSQLGPHLPVPVLGAVVAGIGGGALWTTLGVVIPMGLFNVVGSLQNLDSAAAAGDDYPTKPSLLANGVGTLLGAGFGSPFPTTIYIGHPGWKALGARIGYSVINGAFFTVIGCTGAAAIVGYLVPIEAGMAIVLWIGIVMVAQAFQATPRAHAPAVAVGLLPGIAAWGALMLKTGLRAGGLGGSGPPFSEALFPVLGQADVAAHGAFALEQGFLLTSMVWAAITVEIVERRFGRASLWAAGGSLLSLVGLAHSYAFVPADTVQDLALGKAWQFALAYALLAGFLLLGRKLRHETAAGH